MAGRADVQAGGAFIKLFVKNDIAKGLAQATTQLRKGLNGLKEQAERLSGAFRNVGVTLTAPLALVAAKNEDVKKSLAAIHDQLANAVAPALLPIFQAAERIATAFAEWAEKNQQVIATVAKLGIAALALGAALKGIAIIATIGAFVLTPLGAITAGMGAAAAAAYYFSSTVRDAIGGIAAALMDGKIELAGQIAMESLRVLFQTGVVNLANWIGGTFGDAFGQIGTNIIEGDFARAFTGTVETLTMFWDHFVAGIVEAFASGLRVVAQIWKTTATTIGASMAAFAAALRAMSTIPGGGLSGLAADAISKAGFGLINASAPGGDKLEGLARAADALAGARRGSARGRGAGFAGGRVEAGDKLGELRARFDALAGEAKAGVARAPGLLTGNAVLSASSAAGAVALQSGQSNSLAGKSYSELQAIRKAVAASEKLQREAIARRDRPGIFK